MTRSLPPRRRLRRYALALCLLATAGWLAYRELVPVLVASQVRHELEARGFAHARFRVASVELHHLQLREVQLADGLYLGDVELDAGLSMLWHDRATQLTIRNARISAAMLGRGRTATTALPFQQIRFEDCILELGDDDAEVHGTITLPHGVDLHARLSELGVGTRVLHGVEATARDLAGELEVCLGAHESGIDARACSRVPQSLAAIIALRELATTWTASAATWTAHGEASLAWPTGSLTLVVAAERATIAVAGIPMTVERPSITVHDVALAWPTTVVWNATAAQLGDVRLAAPSGVLSLRLSPDGGFTATGSLHADRLALHADVNELEGRDVSAPLALQGSLGTGIGLSGSFVVTGAEASLRHGTSSALLRHPTVVVGPEPRTLHWHAAEGRIDRTKLEAPSGTIELSRTGVQTVAWTALTGAWPLRAEAGDVVVRLLPRRRELVTGHLHVGTGMLALAPTVVRTDQPLEVVMHARGVELARVLGAFSERVRGSGVLDGDLTIHGSSLIAGSLHARAPGELRVADPAWLERASAPIQGVALQQRLLGALADFEYADLGIVINPRGTKPELRLTTRGRGKLTPQALDLVINVNGVRDAMETIADRSHP